jgi:hypothetical protein
VLIFSSAESPASGTPPKVKSPSPKDTTRSLVQSLFEILSLYKILFLDSEESHMVQRCRQVLLVVLFYLGVPSAYSQNYEVDTASIGEIVNLWNEAHNEINEDSFNELYASTLLFYTNYLDKKVCIEKKLSLLNQRPFRQEIVTNLQLTFYEEGIVYCGFTKEVSTAKGKKSYPSYLLMKRLEDRYVITGESDLVTDRNLKFHLSLGPQIHISELSSVPLPKRSKFKSVYGVVIVVLLLGAAGAAIYFSREGLSEKLATRKT